MFALIETKGATHIAIYVPHEGAEKSLPALAGMLEQNAVFIQQGYQEMKTVTPSIQIVLGNQHRVENYGTELLIEIPASGSLIGADFKHATPEVFVSIAKALKAKADEVSKLHTEMSYHKAQAERLQAQLDALNTAEA